WKDQDLLDREWEEVQAATRDANSPGEFVTFPGYEWQGDGSGGDHNVFAPEEGLPIFHVDTLPELYKKLQGRDAIAIPHHTAYRPGLRGRDWSVFDEELSPFSEIYSLHGCSETDEEWIGMRHNSHMGPGVGGGTYQQALDRGYRLGCICSTDNWGEMPGHYGHGTMACLAPELSREALWNAFLRRRVYGVTGDRIELDFRINGAEMGDVITADGAREITVEAVGWDEIDRIELLRNGRVIATHCHQGTWQMPSPGETTHFRMRVECGWGPRPNELQLPEHHWDGKVRVKGGQMTEWHPCWVSPGQSRPVLNGPEAAFQMVNDSSTVNKRWQNSIILDFEAAVDSEISIDLNGFSDQGAVGEWAEGSHELWYRDDCVRMLEREVGIKPGSPEREDIYYFVAYIAKIHRPMPEAAYRARLEVVDEQPLEERANYRVRVEQRNGQRAWSSPIWVE
ncbi:MAG: hypothetical protein KGZ25_15405, partial [Planctomycetes bacterium]|nr:hypothetical protein [Planctomycetota bacterium]